MNTLHRWNTALQQQLRRGASLALRAALALTAMLVALLVLLTGVLVGGGLLIWALLRGRRPSFVHFRARAGQPGAASREVRARRDVIDAQAREISPEKTA